MKILSKLDSLDNVQDGNTRKLIIKATSSGSGNAVTAVSVSGDTITYTKNTNFLTSHQSAFSNVKVGSSTVAADQAGDTLELVASGSVTLTPDTTNDKVTISATDTKNTTGSTDTSSKIYLVGATSQAANPQTYSDNEVFTTSGVLQAKSYSVNGNAIMQYDTTNDCIKFVFN